MGTATTFAELIAAPGSAKIVLVEIRPAEQLYNWSKTGGLTNVYEKAYLNEAITLADGTSETIRKTIAAVEENGAGYAEVVSTALCDATPSTFFHDIAAGILYVHSSGSDDPDGYVMIGSFWLYFATTGIILDGRYYEPYVAENGIPGIEQSNPSIHWGVSQIGGGSVILDNARGFFDQIARKFIWHNKGCRFLLGGDDLPYSEYTAIFSGRVIDPVFTARAFALSIRGNAFDLLRQLPVNDFWATDFPDLDPAAEGTPIPVYYGIYDVSQAPIVTCINTAYAATTYQFKISDAVIRAITQVYVDYGDGLGWLTIAHANEDLAAATFTITSATFVLGTSRIKVAFEGKHDAGVLIEGAPEIVEDILTSLCGYASGAFDATSFAASKLISTCALNVPIIESTSALTIIEKICQSDLAFFDEDASGLLRYRTWEPSIAGTIPIVTEADILDDPQPEIADDTGQLFSNLRASHGYMPESQKTLWVMAASTESLYRYGKTEALTVETYHRTAAGAQQLADRLNWVTREPVPTISIGLKAGQIARLLGDKIKITLSRAPWETAGGYVQRVFELTRKSLACFPLHLELSGRDLMNFGNNVGFWMSATAPAWATATSQERDDSGFWCDANGLADPTGVDLSSKNISRWW